MPDLDFNVDRVESDPYSTSPLLVFKLEIAQSDGQTPIDTIALRVQLRLEPARRSYSDREEARLIELFGRSSQWSQTLRPMLWTHASAIVPSFTRETIADLPVACTYDFNVAMTKYFDALETGDVPLVLLFSGTIFYRDENDLLQAAPISWSKEATYRLSIETWREMIQRHYPDRVPFMLTKDTIERLREYKTQMGLLHWEDAIEHLLQSAEQKVAQ